jgi:hypothetical protein
MREVIQALLSLQELDTRIFRLRRELERLPQERARRRAQIDLSVAKRDEAKKRMLELRGRVKEIDAETTQARQRMRKVEHEATQSRADVALLAAYQHQIRTLRKEIGTAEEEGVGLLELSETAEAEVNKLQAEIDAAEADFAAFDENVKKESAQAQAELAQLQGERAGRVDRSLPAEAVTLYERLLQAREGVALAEIDGRVCQACYMELPPNLTVRVARGRELAQCPSCDRILHLRTA